MEPQRIDFLNRLFIFVFLMNNSGSSDLLQSFYGKLGLLQAKNLDLGVAIGDKIFVFYELQKVHKCFL
jgi:hypothetical protein